jgi:hypothetical protein
VAIADLHQLCCKQQQSQHTHTANSCNSEHRNCSLVLPQTPNHHSRYARLRCKLHALLNLLLHMHATAAAATAAAAPGDKLHMHAQAQQLWPATGDGTAQQTPPAA